MREKDRELLDYETLKARAEALRRPASTLTVTASDPFRLTPDDIGKAEWFAALWQRFGAAGMHLRRLHYQLVSQTRPLKMWDGSSYLNTDQCFAAFMHASRKLRYLDLVPAEAMEDRRNAEPLIHLSTEEEDGEIEIAASRPVTERAPDMPRTPQLELTPPVMAQRVHVEIWCEKTTINDILEPLAEKYQLNVITGAGDISLTHCVKVVERAQRSGLPVRILYIADFDPKGSQMAVGAARKIEHQLYLKNLFHLDIQVRIVALTAEQCQQFDLPRIPIKDSDTAKGQFEEQHGEGATELDAMEALHPGELAKILEAEIERYYDADLQRRNDQVAETVEEQLAEINRAVDEQYQRELKKLEADYRKISAAYEQQRRRWEQEAKPVYQRIAKTLDDRRPDVHEFDWSQAVDSDEDPNPLFDSTRDYLEQIEAYKSYQGKPTTRRNKRTNTE